MPAAGGASFGNDFNRLRFEKRLDKADIFIFSFIAIARKCSTGAGFMGVKKNLTNDKIMCILSTNNKGKKGDAMYQKFINEELAKLGFIGKYDARHIEAFMRVEHGCLDGLDKATFLHEIRLCARCIDAVGSRAAETFAKTYGL